MGRFKFLKNKLEKEATTKNNSNSSNTPSTNNEAEYHPRQPASGSSNEPTIASSNAKPDHSDTTSTATPAAQQPGKSVAELSNSAATVWRKAKNFRFLRSKPTTQNAIPDEEGKGHKVRPAASEPGSISPGVQEKLHHFITGLERRNPGEPEYRQAVYEVASSILPYIEDKPLYRDMQIFERLTEPDRVVMFRVCWEDDGGNIRTQRGYRVQHNNSIGPYKGGIRFHKNVNLSILKFLAFEQTFKNSLTGLPMGGGKGGADFNPKGKSDNEVMRFCQSFMTELSRHIGPSRDVPAGDIGVGAREIGYMFGQHKRLSNEFTGILTGKGMEFGGSPIRMEATGYGAVYMMEDMLKLNNDSIEGKKCLISGSGNVAQYAAEKCTQLGGKVLTMSDSSGYIYDPNGIDADKLAYIVDLKTNKRGRIAKYADEFGVEYHPGKRPWAVPCDLIIPCATQNEINVDEARTLVKNGCIGVSEGANMPTELEGIRVFQNAKILFAPSKAANAGGVAVSGLEMSQNSARITWKEEELQKLLRDIMQKIHDSCAEYGRESDDYVNYLKGANIAGFVKVADAMLAYGVV